MNAGPFLTGCGVIAASGDYVHQETPRLEFIPMEDRNGEMFGHMGDGAYWTAKPVEVDAWLMPAQRKTQQGPIQLERCVNGGATAHLNVNLSTCTLGTLIARVLKQRLGFRLPNVALSNTRHLFCDRAGPHGFAERERREQTMSKTLFDHGVSSQATCRCAWLLARFFTECLRLQVRHGSVLEIEDCITSQVQRITVRGHSDFEDDSDDDESPLINYGQAPVAPPQPPAAAAANGWGQPAAAAAAPEQPQHPSVPSINDERTYGVQEHEPLRLRMGAEQKQKVVLRNGDFLMIGRKFTSNLPLIGPSIPQICPDFTAVACD